MKSIIWIALFSASFFGLQAQKITLQKGSKTRTINTERTIKLIGSNKEFVKFNYTGIVLSTTKDSITMRLESSNVQSRIGGTKTKQKHNYSIAPDVVIAKKNVRKLYTRRQIKTNKKMILAGFGLIISGIATTVYGAVANEEKASLIGLGQLGISLILMRIAYKNIYKLTQDENVKSRWIMQ